MKNKPAARRVGEGIVITEPQFIGSGDHLSSLDVYGAGLRLRSSRNSASHRSGSGPCGFAARALFCVTLRDFGASPACEAFRLIRECASEKTSHVIKEASLGIGQLQEATLPSGRSLEETAARQPMLLWQPGGRTDPRCDFKRTKSHDRPISIEFQGDGSMGESNEIRC